MAFRMSKGLRNRLLGLAVDVCGNGSFTSDCSGWSSTNAAAPAWQAGGQSGYCMRLANSGSAAGYASQTFTVKPYHGYIVRVYFKLGTSASGGTIKLGTSGDSSTYGSKTVTDATWTEHLFYVEPTTSALVLTLKNVSTTTAEYSDWDEVKCLWMNNSLKDIFYRSKLTIYSGSQPTLAEDAPTGTALCSITTGGSTLFDLEFESASVGVITKKLAVSWSGTAGNAGEASWFRLHTYGDSNTSSDTDCRIDGSIATSGAQLNMASTAIALNSTQTISVFQLTIPPTIT